MYENEIGRMHNMHGRNEKCLKGRDHLGDLGIGES